MKIKITETVIDYHSKDLVAWKLGEKKKWTENEDVPQQVTNQPTSHFGEYFVLNYFKKAQWSGFCFYALGTWEPTNRKISKGRAKIEERFTTQQLSEFRTQRSLAGYASGKGEPDLFLYMEGGPNLFLEVKKATDRVFPAQLNCLATIKSILGADAGIVYLVEHGRPYIPKTYELDLETFTGCRTVA